MREADNFFLRDILGPYIRRDSTGGENASRFFFRNTERIKKIIQGLFPRLAEEDADGMKISIGSRLLFPRKRNNGRVNSGNGIEIMAGYGKEIFRDCPASDH